MPMELAEELAALHWFSDEALWEESAPSMSAAEQKRRAQALAILAQRGHSVTLDALPVRRIEQHFSAQETP